MNESMPLGWDLNTDSERWILSHDLGAYCCFPKKGEASVLVVILYIKPQVCTGAITICPIAGVGNLSYGGPLWMQVVGIPFPLAIINDSSYDSKQLIVIG